MHQKRGVVSVMPKQWVVNPEVDLVSVLAEYGRFLENDYRMAIEHLEVPSFFEDFTEKSRRRFVIVGAKSVPTATAKSVFLCLKLAGPDSVIVKTSTLDECFLVQNVLDYYGDGIRTKVYNQSSDDLKLDQEWLDELENATDIVVFGGQDTMTAFRELETVERRVWEHGPKFSFGIVREEHLQLSSIVREICFDFFSFYGEGCLSPKFYFVLSPSGRVPDKLWKLISAVMTEYYGNPIEEFRSKLPLTRKSDLVQQYVLTNLVAKHVRVEKMGSNEMFSTLYGDARFVVVESLDEVQEFIETWRDQISSVAVNFEDDEETEMLMMELQIPRICDFGEMQFPDFFEAFDHVDDFDIYAKEEEE